MSGLPQKGEFVSMCQRFRASDTYQVLFCLMMLFRKAIRNRCIFFKRYDHPFIATIKLDPVLMGSGQDRVSAPLGDPPWKLLGLMLMDQLE